MVQPGEKGTPLPDGSSVIRLAKLSSQTLETLQAHESNFSLSTEDEESELQSLSVWERSLTPPRKARELMGPNRDQYRLALNLEVNEIRALNLLQLLSVLALDVVWDPDPRSGAEGHAGIIGLRRPPGGNRSIYKTIRAKLARLAQVELIPE